MHEFTKYFKEQLGFDRFINKLKEKYSSLSKFSGTIKLENITVQEAKSLGRLFGIEYKENSTIKLSISKFIKIMENSKYEDFDVKILVEEYLKTSITTKKEDNVNKETAESKFYNEILSNKKGKGTDWFEKVIMEKEQPFSLIHNRYLKNKNTLKKELENIINLLNNLPAETISLSIYASSYTKDPHYLDLDTTHSNLFIYGLASINKENFPTTREQKIKLLKKFKIEVDSVSNFVITYKLKSDSKEIEEFSKKNESLILNVQNILNINKLSSINKKVFIFENPSILSEIIYKKIDASIIITSGIPNTAFYLLVDKLIENGTDLYYNGDFDPEGVLIAEKLKQKYNDKITLFCYRRKDYETCISSKKISNSRIKKLSKINDNNLLGIKELMCEKKLAAYQENNKENIMMFIKEELL